MALEIMRYFFVAYTDPERHSWETAFLHAQRTLGEDHGPVIATRILALVQAMRTSRKSTFSFSSPYCACCRNHVSNSEKHMLDAVCAIERGDPVGARANALVLCEGYDTESFLEAARKLAAEISVRTHSAP